MAGISNDMKIKFQHSLLRDIRRYIQEYIVSALSWGQLLELFGKPMQQQVNKGCMFRPRCLGAALEPVYENVCEKGM